MYIPFRTKLQTNRGNFLLAKVLQHRYPNLFSDIEVRKVLSEYLSVEETIRKEMMVQHQVEDEAIQNVVSRSMEEWDGAYPCTLGQGIISQVKQQIVLFLVSNAHLETLR